MPSSGDTYYLGYTNLQSSDPSYFTVGTSLATANVAATTALMPETYGIRAETKSFLTVVGDTF